MRAEWLSVEIREHSIQGTAVYKGVFPQSNVQHIQGESVAAVIAQLMESWHLLEGGQVIEVELSVSMPTTIELDDEETEIIATNKRRKVKDCWRRLFVTQSNPKDVTYGK